MRLLPAHTREAKDMAKRLKESLFQIGLQRDCCDPDGEPPTLQQTQELMAKAMGYEEGWKELSSETAKPHTPVYIDGLEGQEQHAVSLEAATRLANLLGFDYMHGAVWNAWSNAGVGYSPKWRRQLEDLSTPWGIVLEQEEVAPGILSVTTGSHGGYVLLEERQQRMPLHLRLDAPYYEEDCDWALVTMAFPDEFENDLKSALASVNVYASCSVPRVRNMDPEHEALLAEHLIGYIQPDKDPMNRPPAPDELEVIAYLARCVRANQRPVRVPSDPCPSLQDWVATLAVGPRVDGTWPMMAAPWKPHWGQWQQMAQQEKEWEEDERLLIAEIEAHSRHSAPDTPSN